MEININIEVTRESLTVEVPEASFREKIINGMLLNRSTGQIESIGITLLEYETHEGERDPKKQFELEFAPIFDEKKFLPKQTCGVLLYYLAVAYNKLRPWAPRPLGWLDRIKCDLRFPNYQSVEPEKQFLFEADSQQCLSLSELTINGQEKGWGYWQRGIATNLFIVLQAIAILASAALSYIIAVKILSFLPISTMALFIAILIISSLWVSSKLIPVLWILIAGKIMPKELMRYALEFSNGVGGRKRKLSQREIALLEKYGGITRHGT